MTIFPPLRLVRRGRSAAGLICMDVPRVRARSARLDVDSREVSHDLTTVTHPDILLILVH